MTAAAEATSPCTCSSRLELEIAQAENERLRTHLVELNKKFEDVCLDLHHLVFENRRLRQTLYGRKSERISPDQLHLAYDPTEEDEPPDVVLSPTLLAHEDEAPSTEIIQSLVRADPDDDGPTPTASGPRTTTSAPATEPTSPDYDAEAEAAPSTTPPSQESTTSVDPKAAASPSTTSSNDTPAGSAPEMKEASESEAKAEPSPKPPKKTSSDERKPRESYGRSPIPDWLDTDVVVIEPPERLAPGGDRLERVGEETRFIISIVPSTLRRICIVRRKYKDPEVAQATETAQRAYEAKVEQMSEEELMAADDSERPNVKFYIADPPDHPIDKCKATVALIAFIIVSKYADFLPLNRLQTQTFKRWGLHIAKSTMCGWVKGACVYLELIFNAMKKEALEKSKWIHMDATTALVGDKDKKRYRREYFWAFVSNLGHHLYLHTVKHDSEEVKTLIQGFRGCLVTDGAGIFRVAIMKLEKAIVNAGCWAHARRKFFFAYLQDPEVAMRAIRLINELFRIEAETKDLPLKGDPGHTPGDPDRETERRRRAWPVICEIYRWMPEQAELLKGTKLGQAMQYVINQNVPLTRFLYEGRIPIHNNLAELVLRRIALGRNNWLFFGSANGARWNSILMSLIASCKEAGLEPWAYLQDVLLLLPSWKKSDVLALAPKYWKETRERPEVRQFLDAHPLRVTPMEEKIAKAKAKGPDPRLPKPRKERPRRRKSARKAAA